MTSNSQTPKTDEWMLKADDRGHFNIQILKDGTWIHEGDPIRRDSLVKLFSSVLHLDDDGQHWLVTPVEKGRIDVEVAPLFITAVNVNGGNDLDEDEDDDDHSAKSASITVVCKTGEECTIDADHPIQMVEDAEGEILPVVVVRDGLRALFNRASYYDLMEQVVEGPEPDLRLGLWSAGQFFALEQDDNDAEGEQRA